MYTAFANGDIATLNKVCCPGLANDLASRISRRPRDEKITWALEQYIRTPATYFTGVRIVSDRASKFPNMEGCGARQIVVCITSRQSKGKITAPSSSGSKNSAAVAGNSSTTQQDCTEYIVLQQLRFSDKDEPWRIWGHATPTSVGDLDSPYFAHGPSITERLQGLPAMGRR
ncbi:hypothetical protein PHISCL_02818 [Aspergillus sclerotialis]|uniref:Tim44-like domain-containing protein n=1 Tax=Aspergillus sclerotialis TaxID=2070753 RepID=A0A3A2ZZR0_9EURO|nr:hypothetical protein PHISCL_02818 [Aspergillus sclerotialis]